MKIILLLIACGLLAGCTYPTKDGYRVSYWRKDGTNTGYDIFSEPIYDSSACYGTLADCEHTFIQIPPETTMPIEQNSNVTPPLDIEPNL